MGKLSRWLKGFLRAKTERRRPAMDSDGMYWNPMTIPPNLTPAEAAWLSSFHSPTPDRLRIAADGRQISAVRIQTAFRGYLARKALRALKGLVKIQACVRGCLVRKQAAATLRSMQALVRAQAAVISKRAASLADNPKIVEVDPGFAGISLSGEVSGSGDWWFAGDEWRFSTAQSTPRLGSARESHARANYIAQTRSFTAKSRSRSAPKQRPDVGSKRRVWVTESVMQRSFSHARRGMVGFNFKDIVADKMDRSGELRRDPIGYSYNKW